MEWIRISTNKLKVMLNAEDARRYALNCESADYADSMTRSAFKEILTDVRNETGFDATDDKVYIQMYPSKQGGCELFLTKIGLLMTEPDATYSEKAGGSPMPRPSRSKQAAQTQIKTHALCFSKFENLLALTHRISCVFKGESSAWQDENGHWWLILTENANASARICDYRFTGTYGKMAKTEDAHIFLREHGREVIGDRAVEILSGLS